VHARDRDADIPRDRGDSFRGVKPQYAIGGVGGAAMVAVSLVAARPLALRVSCRYWSP
jgi:hypothetical protein